jgi:hypothetical protein
MEYDAPMLGEHNASLLEKYLGYDAVRVAKLEQAGVSPRSALNRIRIKESSGIAKSVENYISKSVQRRGPSGWHHDGSVKFLQDDRPTNRPPGQGLAR